MANEVLTLLQHAGSEILSIFKNDVNPIIKEGAAVAQGVEPIVNLAFPAIAPLYDLTVSAVVNAEATGQAILGSATGGGAQKFASVIAGLEPAFISYYTQQFGTTPTLAQITAYVNAVVAMLNALPAPATTSAIVGTSTITSTKVG